LCITPLRDDTGPVAVYRLTDAAYVGHDERHADARGVGKNAALGLEAGFVRQPDDVGAAE
jgi:hypothetical protein